jgi:hypothetical protein
MSVPELRRASYPHSLSLSVLAGYEQSFSMPLNNRFSAAARLLWQVGQDLAIGLQPAFRLGNLTTVVLSPKAVYQQSTIQIDSLHTGDNSPSVRGAIDSIYNYVIQEQFDSIIVKQVSAGGSFWEIELPLTVNYKIGKNLYLFGGPSLNFGGKLTHTGKGDVHTVSTVRKDSLAQSEPLPLAAFNNYFGKSPLPAYSSYQPANTGDPENVRIGYLIGVGYEWNRLLFDASLHQQLSGYQNMAESLKPIYKRPTVRLSIGYVLFSNKASRPVTLE